MGLMIQKPVGTLAHSNRVVLIICTTKLNSLATCILNLRMQTTTVATSSEVHPAKIMMILDVVEEFSPPQLNQLTLLLMLLPMPQQKVQQKSHKLSFLIC